MIGAGLARADPDHGQAVPARSIPDVLLPLVPSSRKRFSAVTR